MIEGLTETHCHLNHPDFNSDRDEVIFRARQSGIKRLLVIGFDLASSRFAVEIANAHENIQAVIGIHPESDFEWNSSSSEELIALAKQHPAKVVGWGEIGLDYHWEYADRDLQKSVFSEQLATAMKLDFGSVIHCRDAYSDVMDILEAQEVNRAVLHCFTGTVDEAEQAIALGLFIGVGGIATFKKSEELRAILKTIPIENLLIETDCPYLAPQQWRGKRNEPAYIEAVAVQLASIHGITPEQVAAITSRNAEVLFGVVR